MGIDCEFRASAISNVERVVAISGVYKVYRPGEVSFCPADRWVITTMIKWVGDGYDPKGDLDARGPKVAALLRSLRPYCADLEYGGDNGVPFERVTDGLISAIENARYQSLA
jgi:hypothetical protein